MPRPVLVLHPAALAPAPGAASSRETSYPCSTRAFAAPKPAQPPPMMATRGALEGDRRRGGGGEDVEVEVEEEDEEERDAEEVVGDSTSASSLDGDVAFAAKVEFSRPMPRLRGSEDGEDRRGRRPVECEGRGPAWTRRESIVERFFIGLPFFFFLQVASWLQKK